MLYLFSGLGADKRVFVNIDFTQAHTFIEWVKPLKGEGISDYAARIIEEQIDTSSDVQLLGVSFGGMMAIEVAKKLNIQEVLIISSAKTRLEIPTLYRILGYLKIDTFVPARLLKFANSISYYLFGINTPDEKALLKAILKDTDAVFLKWAIRQIITWKNTKPLSNTIHLHGTHDKLLWHRNISNAIRIDGGGHFMILNKAVILNTYIRNFTK